MQQLSEELEISLPDFVNGSVVFRLGNVSIDIRNTSPGCFFHSLVHPVPSSHKEEVYMRAMQGNLLGQGTGGNVLALDDSGKFLTLSRDLYQPTEYLFFRETLEEFFNYVRYWKEEIARIAAESSG
ncbi:MAG: type III secretion system chaperone [Chlamydiota bacterium]